MQKLSNTSQQQWIYSNLQISLSSFNVGVIPTSHLHGFNFLRFSRLIASTFLTALEKSISLPLDARNIVVKKLAPSKSRIKLTDLKTKSNLLENSQAGEVDLGTEFALLEFPEMNREEIFIKGPLKKSLSVVIGSKVKVSFEYAEMKNQSEMQDAQSLFGKTARGPFAWDFLQPDEKCDARCDGGLQHFSPVRLFNQFLSFRKALNWASFTFASSKPKEFSPFSPRVGSENQIWQDFNETKFAWSS